MIMNKKYTLVSEHNYFFQTYEYEQKKLQTLMFINKVARVGDLLGFIIVHTKDYEQKYFVYTKKKYCSHLSL